MHRGQESYTPTPSGKLWTTPGVRCMKHGIEERGVLGVGSIPVAIIPSCHDMKTIALQLHKHEYSWVVKDKKQLRGSTQVASV